MLGVRVRVTLRVRVRVIFSILDIPITNSAPTGVNRD